MKRKRFDHARVKALYESGLSLNKIADEMLTYNEKIRRSLISQGIARRPAGGEPGEKNHQYRGGFGKHAAGYVRVLGTRNPKLEHREKAEKAMGKSLPKGVVVHHIDTDKKNNANTNLLVCTDSYHKELHARMKKHPYWSQFN